MMDPQGRVAMISGAARGIGRAVTERLLAAGYVVSAGVRDPSRLPSHARLTGHVFEAASPASAEAWVAATIARHGRVDALVNAAGINPRAAMLDSDETNFDAMWTVNAKGPMRVIRAAWAHLVAAGEGRVVNIASLSGKRVRNENLGYAMSKFAVMALTQEVRRQGWDHGIRATSLCPGFVATDMTLDKDFDRDAMTQPQDLAALAVMILMLPGNAMVAEMLVNCRVEDML